MKLTRQQLIQIAPASEPYVDKYINYINGYAEAFHITTPLRMCHYLAQILHESACLKYTEEQGPTHYFDKYDTGRLAKMLGNTPKKDGDGYKYRGRGLIQITGRANYSAYNNSKYCKGDVVNNPELLSKPLGAVKSSMWFFESHNLNKYADKDDLVKITKVINGGTNGLEQRRAFLDKAKSVLLKN